MVLSRFEKLAMNNPIRQLIQHWVEAPMMERLGGRAEGAHVLEIGCGRGVGTQLILNRFGAAQVHALDLDPDMIQRAQRRLSSYGERVSLAVGDASALPAPDATYDAVFDFGIIHHIPHWRQALAEVFRVLRPGGRFFAEEALLPFIDKPGLRRLLDHPLEQAFNDEQFLEGLTDAGFHMVGHRSLAGWFAWYVADRPE